MDLPANIQRAFIARVSGANWIQCAEEAEITTKNLRKWRNHPDAKIKPTRTKTFLIGMFA
mgnify:CR=1 FL=1